jgi:hypothetical protein
LGVGEGSEDGVEAIDFKRGVTFLGETMGEGGTQLFWCN